MGVLSLKEVLDSCGFCVLAAQFCIVASIPFFSDYGHTIAIAAHPACCRLPEVETKLVAVEAMFLLHCAYALWRS